MDCFYYYNSKVPGYKPFFWNWIKKCKKSILTAYVILKDIGAFLGEDNVFVENLINESLSSMKINVFFIRSMMSMSKYVSKHLNYSARREF